MPASRWLGIALLLAFVPISSVLGLARPMVDDEVDGGWGLFADVWEANFWGDLVFTLGTIGAGLAVAWLVMTALRSDKQVPLALLAVAASFVLHWAVYAFSWSFTGATDDGDAFFAWHFEMLYDDSGWEHGSAWGFTWTWGWPGLVFAAIAGPLGAWLVARRAAYEAAPAPTAAAH